MLPFLLLSTSDNHPFSDGCEDGEMGGGPTSLLTQESSLAECEQDPVVLSSADAATSCAINHTYPLGPDIPGEAKGKVNVLTSGLLRLNKHPVHQAPP